ncbi:MAG: CD225/dispanin family protein [Byssovorax sp.]
MRPGLEVPTHLALAIFATFFCCMPFGIVAIVYAAQVNGRLHAGDVAGAEEASLQASRWGWIAFWLGLAFMVACGVLSAIGAPSRP